MNSVASEVDFDEAQEPLGSAPPEAGPSQTTNSTNVSVFRGARNFIISGAPRFLNVGRQQNVNVHNYESVPKLDPLKEFVSFAALYNSSAQDPERRCLLGTREGILRYMRHWIDNPSQTQKVLWLHGPAGVGKSAIAQTLCQLYDGGRIAATFFFHKTDPARNDANRLFPTLAWQLADVGGNAREDIARSMNLYPDTPWKAIEIQFKRLISQPFQSATRVSSQVRTSMPVIVIDGVDECIDERNQRRLLDIIGNAITNSSDFPFRFLISSRPEAHIQDAFRKFSSKTLCIDMAIVDGWYDDIRKFLTKEFARIASEQGLDIMSWPGEKLIHDFIFKSSGQFLYASTIIKFVGDHYNSATAQLDEILGVEPSDGKSPFAELDALYLEILQRQPDQEFLKDFLVLLIVGNNKADGINKDTAMLLSVDQSGLLRKLRGMHSLLKFEPHITPHHQSFVEFLQDSTRSCQYHVGKRGGKRRYLELIVAALLRYASKVMKQPDYHGVQHFSPKFGSTIEAHPRRIKLPLNDWEMSLQPLLDLQDQLLKSATFDSLRNHGVCDNCSTFCIIDDLLLHLTFYRVTSAPSTPQFQHLFKSGIRISRPVRLNLLQKIRNLICGKFRKRERNGEQYTLADLETGRFRGISEQSLDHCLSVLLYTLKETEQSKPSVKTLINLMMVLLRADFVEIALKLRSVSEAQDLVDYIFHFIDNNKFLTRFRRDASFGLTQFALTIYARIPLLPRSIALNGASITQMSSIDDAGFEYYGKYRNTVVRIWHAVGHVNLLCHKAFVWGSLSHDNISTLEGIYEDPSGRFALVFSPGNSLRGWRMEVSPSVSEIQKRMLEIAKGIGYMHSLGIVLDYDLSGDTVSVDPNSRAKIRGYGLSAPFMEGTTRSRSGNCSYEQNVYMFGRLFYMMIFNNTSNITHRPWIPKIHDKMWQLIQRCCSDDPNSRPPIGDVVKEMEAWK